MKNKKIIVGILFVILLILNAYTSTVKSADINPPLYFGINEMRGDLGYSIGNPNTNGIEGNANAAKIWNILQYSNANGDGPTEANVYCVKAGVGFTEGAGTKEIQEYNLQFDMYTERTAIAAVDADSSGVLNGLVNGGHYNELLAVANLIYIPGESTEQEREQLLSDSGVLNIQREYEGLGDENYNITDEEIEAVQQAAMWYFTNYGEENNKYDKTDDTGWLYYTDNAINYSNLTSYGSEKYPSYGEARQAQAEALYNYLIKEAQEQAPNYAENSGNTKYRNKLTLYTSSTDHTSQPLMKVEKNPLEFDLSLRKYITEVNGVAVANSRVPNIDTSTLEDGTTATYKHRKDPVSVRLGDTITYNITIYNEGDLDGRATQIIDQLPTGLRYVGINTQGYTAQYDETTNRVTMTKQTTENLSGYDGQNLDSETIEIECIVESNEGDQILTNLAWISEEVDENGTVITNQVGADRDSEPSTITVPTSDELVTTDIGYIGNSSNTGKDLADSNNYFEGQQDDDDFEKVIIEEITGNYQVQLQKVDEEGNLITSSEAGFRWTLPGQGEQTGTTSNGVLSLGTVQITDPNTPDTIQITETSAPTGYNPLIGSLTVQVTKGESNGNYVATGAQITAGEVEGAEVTLEGNVITIKVPNKLIEGNYQVQLQKVDEEGNLITSSEAGFRWTLPGQGEQIGTTSNGVLNLGTVQITDTTTTDTISITETSAPAGYNPLIGSLTVQVTKGESNGSYIATGAQITAGEVEGAEVTLEGNVITIKVPNELIEGNYQLQLQKVDEDGNLITSSGAEFRWTLPGQGEQTGTTNNGVLTLGTVQITDTTTTDTIPITEISAPTGYSPLIESININVTKKLENGAYVINEVSLTEENENVSVSTNTEGTVITITVKNEKQLFDLSLRKFISQVDETEYDRAPVVDTSGLQQGTTAIYNHTKEPVLIGRDSVIIYTIRVYNEGEVDGYAETITDYLPEELEFLPDHEINIQYEWEVSEDGRTVTTNYLSRENETTDRQNIIHAYDGGETLDYKDIQIACKVKEGAEANKKLTNLAEITEDYNEDNIPDRDSTTDNIELPSDEDLPGYKDDEIDQDYVPGQEDDDDFEKVIVQDFDLSLRKFISQVDDTEYDRAPVVDTSALQQGTTAIYNHTKEPVLVQRNSVVIYTIRVYNEGYVDGYAEIITDHLPEELEYLPEHEINTQYEWQVSSDGRTVTTDYLSREKETEDRQNLLHAYDGGETLDYKDIQIACRVKEEAESNIRLTNLAEITEDDNDYGYEDKDSTPDNMEVPDDENLPGYKDDEIGQDYVPGQEDDDDFEKVYVQDFDLALRKFITKVDEEDVTTRIPEVSYDREQDQITYNHTKDPVEVVTGNIVEYTIRIYNEGDIAGYAQEIADDIPDGLRYLPENETNIEYRWVMYDAEGNVTENVEEAVEIRTDYLSKEQEQTEGENLLQAFNPDEEIGEGNPDYRDIKVAFEVVEPNTSDRIIVNSAQITDDSDENGNPVEDIDSIPDEWNDGEDDQDREYIKLTYFDLALRKWVTEAIVIENGQQTVTQTGHTAEMDPEPVVKVELYRKDLNDVTVKFRYSIRITNEGDIAGYATEITDYVPAGLRFLAEDNSGWTDEGNNVISTRLLENTLLQPGESAEVEVVLTWINGEDNMGQMTNIAEISEDYNDKGVPDRDSTPDNQVWGEDDIDDAPVLLSIETGQERIYFVLGFTVLGTLAGGLVLIKKFVI